MIEESKVSRFGCADVAEMIEKSLKLKFTPKNFEIWSEAVTGG